MSPAKGSPWGTRPTKSAHSTGGGINYSPTVNACHIDDHSTESNSDSGHGTVEQNWYTFRQSHINVLCSIQRE